MEELDYVTADWAREVSEEKINLLTKLQLRTCLMRISEEAKKQKKSAIIGLKPEISLITELEKRGFLVDKFEIFNNVKNDSGFYFKVFW